MAIATYSDLVAAIPAWLFNRVDLAPRIPDFIKLFEAKANRSLYVRQMEGRAYVNVDVASPDPQFISLPLDFQSMRRIRYRNADGTSGAPIQYVLGQQMDRWKDRREYTEGPSSYFTIFGDEIEIYPAPKSTTTPFGLEMIYRKKLPALGPSVSSNWLLEEAPDAYLYGTLLESAAYLHEDERVPLWKAGLDEAIGQLNALTNEALYNAGPLVAGRRRGY